MPTLKEVLLPAMTTLLVLAGGAEATRPTFDDYQPGRGCKIEFTASFEDDEFDFEHLEMQSHATTGAGGGGQAQPNKVRVHGAVSDLRVHGAYGEFGTPDYVPDLIHAVGDVDIRPATWLFVHGDLAYQLDYNNRQSSYLELIWARGWNEEEPGSVWSAFELERANQRVPWIYDPADPIRPRMRVTLQLMSGNGHGDGSLTLMKRSPPHRQVTLPYRVGPKGKCTKVALPHNAMGLFGSPWGP